MRPSIDEVQMALVQAGKVILSVSKGVATWRKGVKKTKMEEARAVAKVETPIPPIPEQTKELK